MKIVQRKNWLGLTFLFLALIITACLSLFLTNFSLSPEQTHTFISKIADLPTDNSQEKTKEEKSKHTVAPHHPRNIKIEKIHVDANIIPLGTLADSTLDAPATAWDVGWYKGSDLPINNSGALLLDGHVNNTIGTPGVFYSLHTLKNGDEITIETGDYQEYQFVVKEVKQLPIDEVDMSSMMKSIDTTKQGLNIITCGGVYNDKKLTFEDRILVYSVRK